MKKTIFAVLLVLWMGFIFSMSSENAEKSSNTSGQTINVVLSTVPEFEKQPEEVKVNIIEELQFIVRKSAHFIGYMTLGILVISLILRYENINKKPQLAFAFCGHFYFFIVLKYIYNILYKYRAIYKYNYLLI